MPDWSKKFKAEYDYARGWLKKNENFDPAWQPLAKDLYKLMAIDGFDAAEASSLDSLRKKLAEGGNSDDRSILTAVGAWTEDARGNIEATAIMRAAALKLLRHVYLLNRSSNREVWVLSLSGNFTDWPSDYLNAKSSTRLAMQVELREAGEHFSQVQKRELANSTQQALAWSQRTSALLASAVKGGGDQASNGDKKALAVVERWFADPGASAADVSRFIGKLSKGFKDITAMLNKGKFILTDWVPLRNASTQDEINFLNSEAFTFASRREGLDVVYIEKSFFVDHPGNVLKGQKNWTRIIVHELTHLVCGTEDVTKGRTRYAWYGIGPHAGFTGSEAVRNADSWAFFCADAAGALVDTERNSALKIV